MLSAVIPSVLGYPALPLAGQLVHQWHVQPGPLVLGSALLSLPTPTADRDRTVSRRSEPSSRTALNGEQPYPWDLLQPQDAMSRHRGAKPPRRCELIASWGWSRSQGYGCSPFKAVRELGSERRETVRSLSAVGVGRLRRADPSTRGPGWTCHWCTSCPAKGSAG